MSTFRLRPTTCHYGVERCTSEYITHYGLCCLSGIADTVRGLEPLYCVSLGMFGRDVVAREHFVQKLHSDIQPCHVYMYLTEREEVKSWTRWISAAANCWLKGPPSVRRIIEE